MNENPVIVITGTRYGIGRYLTEYYETCKNNNQTISG